MVKNPGVCTMHMPSGNIWSEKNRRFVFGKFVKTCRELDLMFSWTVFTWSSREDLVV